MTGRTLVLFLASSLMGACFLPREERAPARDAALTSDREDDEILDDEPEMRPDMPDSDVPLADAPAADADDEMRDGGLETRPDTPSVDVPLADASVAERPEGAIGPCKATAFPINKTGMTPVCSEPECPGITCHKDATGALLMSYAICGSMEPTFAACEFALDQNLAVFDLAYDSAGVIEVVFCAEGADLKGSINLWYGRHPIRKKLKLVLPDEVLAPGCYVRYFSPAQARFPGWPEIPAACREQCGAGMETCLADSRAVLGDYAKMDGGQDYDLHATHVQLVAEDCTGAARGTISLSWVRYLSDGCLCSERKACLGADRPSCRAADPHDCGPWPDSLPSGVCGPSSIGCSGPPGPGVPCAVTVGGRVCQGLTECVEGQYVCPVSDCE